MRERERIGQRHIKALRPGQVVWDSAVIGFGARRQRSEAVSYFVFYRTAEGRQRWQTIGRHGAPWVPDTARDEARRLVGDVARGEDPAGAKQAIRRGITVGELCDRYMADAKTGLVLTRFGSGKKASTLAIDEGRIARHIKPVLGSLPVTAITAADIRNLRDAVAAGKTACYVKTGRRGLARVRGGKGAATRALRLLGGIFTYAVAHGMRADNPVRGVPQFRDGQRERRLSTSEYRALGKALRQADKSAWPPAAAAARFLALTGWRSGEALNLRWPEVDLAARTAVLPGTKTGRSMRPLSNAACDVLRKLQHIPDELVFGIGPPPRDDGKRSRAWRPLLHAPKRTRNFAKRDAELNFIMWLQAAWLEATNELPSLAAKGDISDFIGAGGNADGISSLISQLAAWRPAGSWPEMPEEALYGLPGEVVNHGPLPRPDEGCEVRKKRTNS